MIQLQSQLHRQFAQACMNRIPTIAAVTILMGLAAGCQEKPQVVSPSQQSLAREHLDKAITEVREGRLAKAAKLLDEAIMADPRNADAHNNIGNILMASGKYREAIISYTRAIELSGGQELILFNRGYAYLLIGDKKKALKDFSDVIEQNPDHFQSLSFRGQLRLQSGDFEGAISDFSHVLALRPDEGTAYASRGVSRASLDRKVAALEDFTKAEAIFRKSGDDNNLSKLMEARSALKLPKIE